MLNHTRCSRTHRTQTFSSLYQERSFHFGVAIGSGSLISLLLCCLDVREHELLLVVSKESSASLDVHEKVVHFTDILLVNLGGLTLLSDQVGGRDQMNGVT